MLQRPSEEYFSQGKIKGFCEHAIVKKIQDVNMQYVKSLICTLTSNCNNNFPQGYNFFLGKVKVMSTCSMSKNLFSTLTSKCNDNAPQKSNFLPGKIQG